MSEPERTENYARYCEMINGGRFVTSLSSMRERVCVCVQGKVLAVYLIYSIR